MVINFWVGVWFNFVSTPLGLPRFNIYQTVNLVRHPEVIVKHKSSLYFYYANFYVTKFFSNFHTKIMCLIKCFLQHTTAECCQIVWS